METGAPDGYILSPEKRYVSITKFYTNAAPIIWYNNPDDFSLRTRPKTGDDTPVIPVALLLLATVSGFGFYSYKTKKKKRDEE